MKVSCDNAIFVFEDVTKYQWEEFRTQVEVAETYGRIPRVKFYIGKGISEYHHNLRIGEGAGAVHIGYKHNSAKEHRDSYNMRMEVNPSKRASGPVGDAQEWFRELVAQSFVRCRKLIKGIDVAFDIPVAKRNLFVVSLTGRERGLFSGTEYYGVGGNNGRLKVYDKKKELQQKQGIEIDQEELTRIEFSLRLDEPMTMQFFPALSLSMNKFYQVSYMDLEKTEGVVKACAIAVQSGEMSMNELPRTYKMKTKKAMEDMGLLDLDHEYSIAQKEIITLLKRYLAPTKDSILDHHLHVKKA